MILSESTNNWIVGSRCKISSCWRTTNGYQFDWVLWLIVREGGMKRVEGKKAEVGIVVEEGSVWYRKWIWFLSPSITHFGLLYIRIHIFFHHFSRSSGDPASGTAATCCSDILCKLKCNRFNWKVGLDVEYCLLLLLMWFNWSWISEGVETSLTENKGKR